LNSLGESKETPTAGQELELEPPDEGFFAVLARRDAAGLDAAVRRADAGLDADERLVEDFDAVEDDAGFAADERLVEARRADAGLEAVEDLRAAGGRRAVGFLAAERLAAGADEEAEEASGRSSADTRLARPSTSVRRPFSSSTTRSSSTSRIRLAAAAISPANSCAGPRSDWAPPAVAVNVRSTAERTASTASTAPAGALSFLPLFFFESFFAMTARS